MARILCNLPLECFDDVERYRAEGVELVSYGPPDRMLVDGVHYPFDVAFDPSTESWRDLFARLPQGFEPDFLLIYWPDQEPLPRELESCPAPVVGVMSDYNLGLHLTSGLWPFFDVLLCDRGGVGLYANMGFADVREWVQFSFKAPTHFPYADERREVDVAFAGNLNPRIQRERAPFLERLRRLETQGVCTEIVSGVHGEAYGRLLSRAKIGFNRSVRGEMNLRAFEVPACGAALLMESSNEEVRDFLTPDEEVVLYDDDNLEEVVLSLLDDEPRRERIARAGHARIQQHRMSRRIATMLEVLGDVSVRRTPSTPAEAASGRARAMLQTWAAPERVLAAAVEAQRLAPDDPAILNDLAVALFRVDPNAHAERAVGVLQRALSVEPHHVVAACNLQWIVDRAATEEVRAACGASYANAVTHARDWHHLDGLLLPPGFDDRNLGFCAGLAEAVRAGSIEPLRARFVHGFSARVAARS